MEVVLHRFEDARLRELDSYRILDTPTESAFDRLTRLAAHVMGTPISLVSFVASDRQFVKSCYGLSISETGRDLAFCAHAILSDKPLVVLDATADQRFSENPLVTGPPNIRFYVGAPLITSSGLPLGALCAIDRVPHAPPTEAELQILTDLAAEVVAQLELRNSRRELDKAIEDLAQVQQGMLRATPASCRLKIDLSFYPKHMAGGDFLCHYKGSEDKELLLLTDVSGHDLKAAYQAAHAQGMVRALMNRAVPAVGILEELNTYFLEQSENSDTIGTSLAACAISCYLNTFELVVRNYGSPVPFYIDFSGFPHLLDDARGSPLGWSPTLEDATSLRVFNGGSLVVWTDGLEELASELGITPLNLALRLRRERLEVRPDWLLRACDDIMSAFIKLPSSSAEVLEQDWWPFVFQAWDADSIKDIDTMQHSWARDLQFAIPGICDCTMFDILLCTREAALNGMLHGCKDGGKVTICMRLNRKSGLIRVTVCDEGPGHSFDPTTRENPDLPADHRGLLLILQLSTSCIRERNGASLNMEFAYELSCEGEESTFGV